MADYYPPVGFHFKVEFTGLDKELLEVGFQSVSGLSVDMQTESIKEGGVNRYEHILPVRTKYNNLVLKRGMVTNSKLIEWFTETFSNRLEVNPIDVTVKLLNEQHDPLMTWNVIHAWPKKWSVADFNAEQSSVLIETLELQYHYFTLI